MEYELTKQLGFASLKLQVTRMGKDWLLALSGGDAPHIGCAVLAIPRPSLTGDGSVGVTASVLNVVGHKDEVLCRRLAEQVAKGLNTCVVCTGGVHIDGITQEQIGILLDTVDQWAKKLIGATD